MGCSGGAIKAAAVAAPAKSSSSSSAPAQAKAETAVEEEEEVDEAALKEQRKKAKKMVKHFVSDMVRGRKLEVVLKTGKTKNCACSMSRALDTLKIKVGNHSRRIPLIDIQEIHAGSGLKRVDTPLDELCVTLILVSEDAITFRFAEVEERDTFAACMLMFVQRLQADEDAEGEDFEAGDDDSLLPWEAGGDAKGTDEVESEDEEQDADADVGLNGLSSL
mmetsp:Transcript_71472/g.115316  ORF Transcript_71472/g.115316 Transcript_71472/m.115316 type:complete len:220 (+) Transcript_71472:125-784(+)